MAGAGDVTDLLKAWSGGEPDALGELAMLVQHELRQMARRLLAGEPSGHGWQATELINESYRALDRVAAGRVAEPRPVLRELRPR